VLCHGGPTGATDTALNFKIQFWTSRGFAIFDINYRGSTGYGRAFRDSLKQHWGVKDVDDVCAGAQHLVTLGLADPKRLAIKGGSAGGYTVLAALTFKDTFSAGASHYGIGDLETLARDTHKFESRYLDSMIGPYPEQKTLYQQRSPINHAEQLNCPVIFFQGLEDKVVPPNQAEAMHQVLKDKNLAVSYVPFAGEGHGFRGADAVIQALEGELYFYSKVFGFDLPEPISPVPIDNMDKL
jgi:dipeptidyl aminopeptidase/acylaminoacyl peptidase